MIGIEPNREMRERCGRLSVAYPAFRCLDGAAEHIPLPPQSVDLVVVGQALHWFDAERAKAEFLRILRGNAFVAVLWNVRLTEATEFTREYDTLCCTFAKTHPTPSAPAFSTGLDRLFGIITPH